jgi:hypothetical protein
MRHALASTTDWVRLGLAANLKYYVFTSHTGQEIKGGEVLTHDNAPVAYASSPEELVSFGQHPLLVELPLELSFWVFQFSTHLSHALSICASDVANLY